MLKIVKPTWKLIYENKFKILTDEANGLSLHIILVYKRPLDFILSNVQYLFYIWTRKSRLWSQLRDWACASVRDASLHISLSLSFARVTKRKNVLLHWYSNKRPLRQNVMCFIKVQHCISSFYLSLSLWFDFFTSEIS